MNTITGIYVLIGILLSGGIAGHFNRYPGDWKILISAIKDGLSDFIQWAIRTKYWGPIVFGAACGILVVVITWPWSY